MAVSKEEKGGGSLGLSLKEQQKKKKKVKENISHFIFNFFIMSFLKYFKNISHDTTRDYLCYKLTFFFNSCVKLDKIFKCKCSND